MARSSLQVFLQRASIKQMLRSSLFSKRPYRNLLPMADCLTAPDHTTYVRLEPSRHVNFMQLCSAVLPAVWRDALVVTYPCHTMRALTSSFIFSERPRTSALQDPPVSSRSLRSHLSLPTYSRSCSMPDLGLVYRQLNPFEAGSAHLESSHPLTDPERASAKFCGTLVNES